MLKASSSASNYRKKLMNSSILQNPNKHFTNLPSSLIHCEILNKAIKGKILSNTEPETLNYPEFSQIKKDIKKDTKKISEKYLKSFISIGSYSSPLGNNRCIDNIKKAMDIRDEIKDKKNDLIALEIDSFNMIQNLITVIVNGKETGILLPNPSDLILGFFGGNKGSLFRYDTDVGCFGKTLANVQMEIEKLGPEIKTKIFFVSNPDTFNGKVLSVGEIENCLEFCFKNNLVLLVDESFQQSTKSEFNSFRKILNNYKNTELRENQELITFYDPAKSLFPMASLQGGIITLSNFDEYIKEMYYKMKNMFTAPSISQINSDLNFSLFYDNSLLSQKTNEFHKKEIERNKNKIFSFENKLKNNLENLSNLEMYNSDGGFSIWAKIEASKFYTEKFGNNLDLEISGKVWDNCGVFCQAGSTFGRPGFLRFSKVEEVKEYQLDGVRESISLFRN